MSLSTNSEGYEEVVTATGGELSHFTKVIGANGETIQKFYEVVPTNQTFHLFNFHLLEPILKT
ncbi:hypothetical protein CU098_001433, partial [Rhizopus stolonifer]